MKKFQIACRITLLTSALGFTSISHAYTCQDLTGNWRGIWIHEKLHTCQFAVDVFVEERDGLVRMEAYNFSKMVGDNRFCRPPAGYVMKGTCFEGEIRMSEGQKLRGLMFSSNEISLHDWDIDIRLKKMEN